MTWAKPSEEAFNHDWIRANEVLDLLAWLPKQHRRRWLLDGLKEGLIVAVARNGPMNPNMPVQPLVPVMTGMWHRWDDDGEDYFWQTGNAIFVVRGGYNEGSITNRFFDVRFDPASFDGRHNAPVLPPPAVSGAPTAVEMPGRRGAKRKEWWDALWIEMIRRMESDTLAPSGPAELQRIMLDWLGEHGIFPGEDTLKKTASNLFKYLEERRGI